MKERFRFEGTWYCTTKEVREVIVPSRDSDLSWSGTKTSYP